MGGGSRAAALMLVAAAMLAPESVWAAPARDTEGRAATQMCEEMAQGVVAGREHGKDAVSRLRKHPNPWSLGGSKDEQLGHAAIDMGMRLVAAGKAEEAVPFFEEAEAAFARLVAATPDKQAQQKAQYLNTLAMVRAQFLNKAAQAAEDRAAAEVLQPPDPSIRRMRGQRPDEARSPSP